MIDARWNNQNVTGLHVVRPMRDPVSGLQEHPDNELFLFRGALRADASRERSDTEREVADTDMVERASQLAALKLHHVDMRPMNRFAKALEIVHEGRRYRKCVVHLSSLTSEQRHGEQSRTGDLYRARAAAKQRQHPANLSELWFERSESRAAAAVAAELLIVIPNEPDSEFLGEIF